jgi:transcriptional regulator with XRE-family HTH domain
MISVETKEKIFQLGKRLRENRLDRDEPQERFAARLGVSVPTLRKMENGDPNVKIGTWIEALWLLNRLSDVDSVLKKDQTLFDEWDKKQKKKRQRATKRW